MLKVNTDCKDKNTLIVQMYSSDNASGNLCICTVFSPYSHLIVQVAQCVECQASGPPIKEDRTYTPIIVKYPFFFPQNSFNLSLYTFFSFCLALCLSYVISFLSSSFRNTLVIDQNHLLQQMV